MAIIPFRCATAPSVPWVGEKALWRGPWWSSGGPDGATGRAGMARTLVAGAR
ncbi:hypothetical protein [Corynebacterium sp. AOP34-AQ2-28]|uniref:hypothetical protein n=1 Tax=Corynebacterium sp. AOP34-AQ2-28 TaxID=3457689 RepID=UPI004034E82D